MNPESDPPHHCIQVCNRLLREEISAVETYNQILAKFSSEPEACLLSRIREDHLEAVSRLQAKVREMGGQPDTETGDWGAFTRAAQATATHFGKYSAISEIERGERLVQYEYEDVLGDSEMVPQLREMVRRELLPKVERNIEALDQLIQ